MNLLFENASYRNQQPELTYHIVMSYQPFDREISLSARAKASSNNDCEQVVSNHMSTKIQSCLSPMIFIANSQVTIAAALAGNALKIVGPKPA